jgi:hypothetical protein
MNGRESLHIASTRRPGCSNRKKSGRTDGRRRVHMMVSATHDSEHGKQHSCRAFLLSGSTKQTSTSQADAETDAERNSRERPSALSRARERRKTYTPYMCGMYVFMCVCWGVRAHRHLRRIACVHMRSRIREENYPRSLARAIPSMQNRFCHIADIAAI